MTPIVGEMKAIDMTMALGKPSALRFSSLVPVPAAVDIVDMEFPPGLLAI
jgi:hypothetical protein